HLKYINRTVNTGFYSRLREVNKDSSFSVLTEISIKIIRVNPLRGVTRRIFTADENMVAVFRA
ncbi:unnamed protein product, partial [marine sediment metagenome]